MKNIKKNHIITLADIGGHDVGLKEREFLDGKKESDSIGSEISLFWGLIKIKG